MYQLYKKDTIRRRSEYLPGLYTTPDSARQAIEAAAQQYAAWLKERGISTIVNGACLCVEIGATHVLSCTYAFHDVGTTERHRFDDAVSALTEDTEINRAILAAYTAV